jgi:hypothetical protein
MQRREWYMVGYGVDLGGTGELIHYTYGRAKAAAGKYPVRRLVLDESWVEPEEEWVTPTDQDARYRPMVEVSLLGDWSPARLLAVLERDNAPRYVVFDGDCDDIDIYSQCRMRASERNKR